VVKNAHKFQTPTYSKHLLDRFPRMQATYTIGCGRHEHDILFRSPAHLLVVCVIKHDLVPLKLTTKARCALLPRCKRNLPYLFLWAVYISPTTGLTRKSDNDHDSRPEFRPKIKQKAQRSSWLTQAVTKVTGPVNNNCGNPFTMTKHGQRYVITYMNNKLLLVIWSNQNAPT
jgi:hypothetical protein